MDTPTPQRCAKVYWLGFGLVTSLYVIVAVCGYYTFGDAVPSNIVDAYPKNARRLSRQRQPPCVYGQRLPSTRGPRGE